MSLFPKTLLYLLISLRVKYKAFTLAKELMFYYYNHIKLLIFSLADKSLLSQNFKCVTSSQEGLSLDFMYHVILPPSFNCNLFSVSFLSNINSNYSLLIYYNIFYLCILFYVSLIRS